MPDLCTLEQVKDALGITTESEDANLERLISAASTEILREMRRPDLTPDADYTDRICGNGLNEIFLQHWPVNSITSVTIDGIEISEADFEACTPGWFFDETADPENRQKLQLIGLCFPRPCRPFPNIVVEYNAGYGGYGPDDVPSDIVQAAIEQTAFKRTQGQVQSQNISSGSVQIGDYTESAAANDSAKFLSSNFPQSVKDVIDRYRRPEV